jgi:hypothetical protein
MMMTIVYINRRDWGGVTVEVKSFSCREVNLPYADMVALRNAGALNLGIDHEAAFQISAQKLGPAKTAVSGAFHFWNFIAMAAFGVSVYMSFTINWWWFLVGLVALFVIWNANKKGNATNLLDAAMVDPAFYERVRYIGGWLYQIDEGRAAKYKKLDSEEH